MTVIMLRRHDSLNMKKITPTGKIQYHKKLTFYLYRCEFKTKKIKIEYNVEFIKFERIWESELNVST